MGETSFFDRLYIYIYMIACAYCLCMFHATYADEATHEGLLVITDNDFESTVPQRLMVVTFQIFLELDLGNICKNPLSLPSRPVVSSSDFTSTY